MLRMISNNLIIRFILEFIGWMWNFFRLFVTALTWGWPFLLLLPANSNPGVASDPKLARLLETLLVPFVFVIPVFVLLGLLTVAWPSQKSFQLSYASAFSLFVLVLIASGLALVITRDFMGVIFLTPILLLVVVPILGIMVTANSLWHRHQRLAVIWVGGYMLMIGTFFWLADRTQAKEPGLGEGLLIAFGIGILLIASFIGSMVALLITSLLNKRIFEKQS